MTSNSDTVAFDSVGHISGGNTDVVLNGSFTISCI